MKLFDKSNDVNVGTNDSSVGNSVNLLFDRYNVSIGRSEKSGKLMRSLLEQFTLKLSRTQSQLHWFGQLTACATAMCVMRVITDHSGNDAILRFDKAILHCNQTILPSH